MARLADYRGHMLNHMETLYQRDERELAVEFYATLGCEVVDTGAPCEMGSTYLFVYPEKTEQDRINNVLYLSEVRDAQWALERELRDQFHNDSPLARTYAEYRKKALTAPHGIPHFGLRYSSFASLENVIQDLGKRSGGDFEGRVHLSAVIRPGDQASMADDILQAFVWTDLVASGLFALGRVMTVSDAATRQISLKSGTGNNPRLCRELAWNSDFPKSQEETGCWRPVSPPDRGLDALAGSAI